MTTELTLDYEKLDVYQVALQFLALSAHIIADLPGGYSAYADQLRRAALSIVLNIAEGVGRTQMAGRASRALCAQNGIQSPDIPPGG